MFKTEEEVKRFIILNSDDYAFFGYEELLVGGYDMSISIDEMRTFPIDEMRTFISQEEH